SQTISVVVNGDTVVEANETFFVNLSGAVNATIADGQGIGTINNDDVQSNLIVISQVFGGGGNSGAKFKNDYIELFNRGNATVDITGWSVQYASAAGTTWQKTDLTGSIPPGGYYLVQEAAGTGKGTALPTPNAIGNIAMSATSGKVALVNNGTLLTGSGCPF